MKSKLTLLQKFTSIRQSDNNLMILGGSVGNIPQTLKTKLIVKTRHISDCLSIFKIINGTLENVPTIRNISSFYKKLS
jgi:hypothetical protein